MYNNRKVKWKDEQKEMVCKIRMRVYTNMSFINGKRRLQMVHNNYRDIIIS